MRRILSVREWRRMFSFGRHCVGLVHPAVADDGEAMARHVWFVSTRLGVGALALACVPLILVMTGSLGPLAASVVALGFMQALAGAYTSRTGDLWLGYVASLIGFAVI